jgi:hypothetical protein
MMISQSLECPWRGPLYSNTGEQGQREETSKGDLGGGGDPYGTGGGVLVLLGGGLPSTEGECSRLRHLLSSIVGKQRARERGTLSKKEQGKGIRDGSRHGTNEIFIA